MKRFTPVLFLLLFMAACSDSDLNKMASASKKFAAAVGQVQDGVGFGAVPVSSRYKRKSKGVRECGGGLILAPGTHAVQFQRV